MQTEILVRQNEGLIKMEKSFELIELIVFSDKLSLKGLYPYQTPPSLWSNIRNSEINTTLYLARILAERGNNVWIDPNARTKSGGLLPACVAVHGTSYGKRLLNKIAYDTPGFTVLRVALSEPVTELIAVPSLDEVTKKAQATYWQEQTRLYRRLADQDRDWRKYYEIKAINALAEMTYLQAFGYSPFSGEEINGLVLAIVDEVLDKPEREWIEALRQSSLPNSCC